MNRINFIPHVHWDREWLRSSDASRIKLVYFFDRLLDMLENDPEMKSFTFDGQTAALEDYLAIKPFNRQRVSRLVETRKLFVGPWYVQPDMIIPSGESLVRNLLLGSKYAKALGHCMEVGWVPDAFGQSRNTPYLFKELGMKGVYAWRGFDYDMLQDSLFMWQGNGGCELPAIHFALGYGHYRGFPEDYEDVKKDMETVVPKLEERYHDGEILFMLGSDYAFPRRHTTRMINHLQEDGYNCRITNPESFLEAIIKAAAANGHDPAKFEGEARSAALGRIHAGITSTRIDIKNAMRYYETLMSKVIEPMINISHAQKGYCDQELVNYFWKIIFKNQFHDSIYGSSPTTVNKTVENRLLNLRHGLNELIWMNFRFLAEKADLSELNDDEDILVLYNTLPYRRYDYAFVSMIVRDKDFTLMRRDGTVIPYQVMSEHVDTNHEIEYYNGMENFHDTGEVHEGTKYLVQLKLDASFLPEMGYEILKVSFGKSSKEKLSGELVQLDRGAENKFLKMHIQDDGTITVYNKQTHEMYQRLNTFVDKGDDGDEYNYSPCVGDHDIRVNDQKPRIILIESSPIEVKYRIEYGFMVPEKVVKHRRNDRLVAMKIISDVSLKSRSQTLDFKTTVDNNGCDHIVRVTFDDIHEAKQNCSQDQFGTIIRDNVIENQKRLDEGSTEYVLPIYSMQRFVKLNHDKHIMALITKGPLEYEIENNRKICLTLLRSVGKFGKADLVVRPGRSSGYRMDVPTSQLLGKSITSEYSLFFGRDNSMSDLIKTAELLNTPIQTRYLNDINRSKNQELDWDFSLMKLDKRVELMALKHSENNQYTILRVLNNNDYDITDAVLKLYSGGTCYLSDVNESRHEEIENIDGTVYLPKIVANTFITIIIE